MPRTAGAVEKPPADGSGSATPSEPDGEAPDSPNEWCLTQAERAERVGDVQTQPSAPGPYRKNQVACGALTCAAGRELCCLTAGGPRCVPYTGPRVQLHELAAACSQQQAPTTDEYPVPCDDSGDCPLRHTCCLEHDHRLCVPLAGDGWNRCGDYEVCAPGSPCRSAGTSCSAGSCAAPRPSTSIECFGQKCTGSTPICCAPPRTEECHREAKCVRDARECYYLAPAFTCLAPADCPRRQVCVANPLFGWTWCVQSWDAGNTALVCRTDADCPKHDPLFGKRLRCVDHEDVAGLRVCLAP